MGVPQEESTRKMRPTDQKVKLQSKPNCVWAHKKDWNGCPRDTFFLKVFVRNSYLGIFIELFTVISKLKCVCGVAFCKCFLNVPI